LGVRGACALFTQLTLGGRVVFVLIGLGGALLAILYLVAPPPPPIQNGLAAALVGVFTIFGLALVIVLDAGFQAARRKIANPS
jgi:hypothetical protein